MDNVILQNKPQLIAIKLKELMFAMIVTQHAMLALISYQQNAPNANLASSYGKEHVNLHVLNLPTNMNKISNVLKLVLGRIRCKKLYACIIAPMVL